MTVETTGNESGTATVFLHGHADRAADLPAHIVVSGGGAQPVVVRFAAQLGLVVVARGRDGQGSCVDAVSAGQHTVTCSYGGRELRELDAGFSEGVAPATFESSFVGNVIFATSGAGPHAVTTAGGDDTIFVEWSRGRTTIATGGGDDRVYTRDGRAQVDTVIDCGPGELDMVVADMPLDGIHTGARPTGCELVAPQLTGPLTLTGVGAVGQTLTFSGPFAPGADPPDPLSFNRYDSCRLGPESSEDDKDCEYGVGSGPTYTVRPQDAGRWIYASFHLRVRGRPVWDYADPPAPMKIAGVVSAPDGGSGTNQDPKPEPKRDPTPEPKTEPKPDPKPDPEPTRSDPKTVAAALLGKGTKADPLKVGDGASAFVPAAVAKGSVKLGRSKSKVLGVVCVAEAGCTVRTKTVLVLSKRSKRTLPSSTRTLRAGQGTAVTVGLSRSQHTALKRTKGARLTITTTITVAGKKTTATKTLKATAG